MNSTKVQNPWPIATTYQANNAQLLAAPCGVAVLLDHFSLLRRLAASVVWGTAEPAIRPSKTILHDSLLPVGKGLT